MGLFKDYRSPTKVHSLARELSQTLENGEEITDEVVAHLEEQIRGIETLEELADAAISLTAVSLCLKLSFRRKAEAKRLGSMLDRIKPRFAEWYQEKRALEKEANREHLGGSLARLGVDDDSRAPRYGEEPPRGSSSASRFIPNPALTRRG